jgi:putative spermidine/putrescine transport system permease protein
VHATIGLPIAFLIIQTCMTEQLRELDAAAAGLGANPIDVARRVTLPLLTPVLLAAGIAVFVLSLNESLVSVFLATPTNETLPAVIWPQLRYSPSPMVAEHPA